MNRSSEVQVRFELSQRILFYNKTARVVNNVKMIYKTVHHSGIPNSIYCAFFPSSKQGLGHLAVLWETVYKTPGFICISFSFSHSLSIFLPSSLPIFSHLLFPLPPLPLPNLHYPFTVLVLLKEGQVQKYHHPLM